MKWFKHYADAHDNKSLTKVRIRYGADGYAIYWYCLELISGGLGTDENITFELKHDAEVIGYNLKIDRIRVEEIMNYMVSLNLFENAEGVITCLKLSKYLDKKNTRNKTIHRIIDKYSEILESKSVADSRGHVADNPRLSPLDTDTDTDIDKDLKTSSCAKQSFTPDEKVTKFDKTPYEEILNLYHEILPELNSVKKLTPARKTQIKTRWRNELDSIDEWRDYFELVRESGFLMGKTDPGRYRSKSWQADIDWLIKQGNVVKVCEGKYHEHG